MAVNNLFIEHTQLGSRDTYKINRIFYMYFVINFKIIKQLVITEIIVIIDRTIIKTSLISIFSFMIILIKKILLMQ